ncbi:hypothetical protein OAG1_31030 [Agarivorans sp. OAG1]|uniref:hypothetical protein n=1 Tax=Agarivorans sp. OAG1 TaxID=3082387 RepID=UPI002B30250D|nr:hypothetical protein OAG1_31030 [Agarivorans sp. OAG1]
MKSEILKYFQENIEYLEGCDGGGLSFSLPKFDLRPKNFLTFSELDLNGEHSLHSLVNATGNLKRAMDCELDTLMSVLGLDDLYRKKRLGVDKKLGFLERSGVFKASSLDRINKLRNRLEHHYETPSIEDVQVYFDLVTAFISIGDSFLYKLRSISEVNFSYLDYNHYAVKSSISLRPTKVDLVIYNIEKEIVNEFVVKIDSNSTVDDLYDFSYLLKVNQLLGDFYHKNMSRNEFVDFLGGEI